MAAYSTFSDQELVALVKEGDHAAFTEIYLRFINPLFIHAFNRLKDEQGAQDIIQELFTVLWEKRQTIQITSLSSYLYSAVRNRILDTLAHEQLVTKHKNALPSFIKSERYVTDYRIRERQLAEIIEKEVAALPNKMREVFELSRKQQLSHSEIAEKLGISEQSVRSHVKNALRILRVRLGIAIFIAMYFVK